MKNYKNRAALCASFFCFVASFSQISTQLIFEENFNGTTLDLTKWEADNLLYRSDEVQCYTMRPENVKVRNNNLELIALQENYTVGVTNFNYTSGSIKTKSDNPLQYGKYEARIKVPQGLGYFPAFWTLGLDGTNGWPACGEIDIMENLGTETFVRGTCHWLNTTGVHESNPRLNSPSIDLSVYHIYSVIWLPESITWYVDGVSYGSLNILNNLNSTNELHTGHRILLNFALGGWPPSPDATTPFPATMFVDYVRVYKYDAALGTNDVENTNNPLFTVSTKDNICKVKLPKTLSDFDLTFYDMSGKKLLTKKVFNTNETTIDISTLSKGSYILNVVSTSGDKYSGIFLNN
jgi:beta-glucanase (GH16 family)